MLKFVLWSRIPLITNRLSDCSKLLIKFEYPVSSQMVRSSWLSIKISFGTVGAYTDDQSFRWSFVGILKTDSSSIDVIHTVLRWKKSISSPKSTFMTSPRDLKGGKCGVLVHFCRTHPAYQRLVLMKLPRAEWPLDSSSNIFFWFRTLVFGRSNVKSHPTYAYSHQSPHVSRL